MAKLILVTALSNVWACDRWLVGSANSNPAEGMDLCRLRVLFVVEVEVCARVWYLVQRNPTECVCVSLYAYNV